jgi:hypothetical protein
VLLKLGLRLDRKQWTNRLVSIVCKKSNEALAEYNFATLSLILHADQNCSQSCNSLMQAVKFVGKAHRLSSPVKQVNPMAHRIIRSAGLKGKVQVVPAAEGACEIVTARTGWLLRLHYDDRVEIPQEDGRHPISEIEMSELLRSQYKRSKRPIVALGSIVELRYDDSVDTTVFTVGDDMPLHSEIAKCIIDHHEGDPVLLRDKKRVTICRVCNKNLRS